MTNERAIAHDRQPPLETCLVSGVADVGVTKAVLPRRADVSKSPKPVVPSEKVSLEERADAL